MRWAWLIVAVSISVASAVGFLGAREVAGHGTHCGVPPILPCNTGLQRYYATQYRCCDYGIKSNIKVDDVALLDTVCENPNVNDPKCNFNAHWVGVTGLTGDWVQMGFWEGIWGFSGSSPIFLNSPRLYAELAGFNCPASGYEKQDLGTVTGNFRHVVMHWSGVEGQCGGGNYGYLFHLKLGGSGSPPFDQVWLENPYGRMDATTEHFVNTHFEPNGTACFGTSIECVGSGSFGLRTFNYVTQQWNLLTVQSAVVEQAGYFHNQLVNYYSLTTTGY